MNLSENSIKILQNFSEINLNLLIKPGKTISTISQMKNILAQAELAEDFSEEFAIYDLAEFLRALELIEKPKLTFNGGSSVLISDEKNTQSINYRFADKSVITSPSKLIEIPDKEVTFTLTASAFLKLQKGITALALPDVTVQGKDGNLLLTATDKKNKTSISSDKLTFLFFENVSQGLLTIEIISDFLITNNKAIIMQHKKSALCIL